MITTPAQRLIAASERLADLLRQCGCRIVFAESCTAGLVAASLARIPGVSHHLCGSAVVYRNATKTAWLGVPADVLADDCIGPVSPQAAAAMSEGVLARTPEADLALSITGHLGPDAPAELDGLIYVGITTRSAGTATETTTHQSRLVATQSDADDQRTSGHPQRVTRQQQAAAITLELAADTLASRSQ